MRAIVTGATAGIGGQIAKSLVDAGLEVVITGRDAARGEAAAVAIGATFLRVDHSSLAANRAAGAQLARTPIDILVNNVGGGAAVAERTTTAEGHELNLALNYLGPVTLTRELLPALTPGAHVVNVVSSAYAMVRGDPWVESNPYVAILAHARSKQLHLLATMSLARRLGDAARVNAVNPGMAWTPGTQALTPAAVPAWRYIWPVVRFFQRRASPAKAARCPIMWALRPPTTGAYVESDSRPRPLPVRLRDPVLQDRAWEWPVTLGDAPMA
jgi:NAD(P)-dependent dehydrogenase (short-subunit alcohol dehydrogenase family)